MARASQAEGSARSQSEVKFHFRYRISRKVNLIEEESDRKDLSLESQEGPYHDRILQTVEGF